MNVFLTWTLNTGEWPALRPRSSKLDKNKSIRTPGNSSTEMWLPTFLTEPTSHFLQSFRLYKKFCLSSEIGFVSPCHCFQLVNKLWFVMFFFFRAVRECVCTITAISVLHKSNEPVYWLAYGPEDQSSILGRRSYFPYGQWLQTGSSTSPQPIIQREYGQFTRGQRGRTGNLLHTSICS
jgi:hypothetical protein